MMRQGLESKMTHLLASFRDAEARIGTTDGRYNAYARLYQSHIFILLICARLELTLWLLGY